MYAYRPICMKLIINFVTILKIYYFKFDVKKQAKPALADLQTTWLCDGIHSIERLCVTLR